MLAAETPDIHRLQPAYAPVVLDLDPREAAEDIGHLCGCRQGAGQNGLLSCPDDGEGLVKMEFDFRFVENQSENRATGTLSQGLTMSVDDVWDEVAIAAEHVSPNDNIIY